MPVPIRSSTKRSAAGRLSMLLLYPRIIVSSLGCLGWPDCTWPPDRALGGQALKRRRRCRAEQSGYRDPVVRDDDFVALASPRKPLAEVRSQFRDRNIHARIVLSRRSIGSPT